MNIADISDILNRFHLGPTPYELENFFIDSFSSRPRQLVAVLERLEELYCQQLELANAISLSEDEISPIRLQRQLQKITNEYNRLQDWYNNQNIDEGELQYFIDTYEGDDLNYWVTHLGRLAAIEIITYGKVKFETMDKMSLLPASDFEEAVRICNRYANLIRSTTAAVEASMTNASEGISENNQDEA
jgi:hypothetical protein